MALNELFTDIANAIRSKKGTTDKIIAENFPQEISDMGESLEIEPSQENKSFEGLYSKVTVAGDNNLTSENIKKGVSIFGVQGIHEGASEEEEETEYIELTYIESTGTQYIDTGYMPNADTSLEFEMCRSETKDAPIFSASNVWSTSTFLLTCIFDTGYSSYHWWYYDNPIFIKEINTTETIEKFFIYRGYIKVNDEVLFTNTEINNNLKVTSNLTLFGGPIAGPEGQFTRYRLHSFKISESGLVDNPTYIRDFIPVQMRETGEIGLYDKVEEKFYPNKGTGVFLAGNEIKTDSLKTLKGKKISILGDSISTFNGYMPNGYATYYPNGDITSVGKTWWHQLISENGMELVKNASWSGSCVTGDSTSTTDAFAGCSTARMNDLKDGTVTPDIIVIYLGINDFGLTNQRELGEYTGSTAIPSEGTITTFSEAYGLMLKKALETYPKAKVFCCTLLETAKSDYDTVDSGTYPTENSNTILEHYNERIKTIASKLGAKVIDLHSCGINYWNLSTYTIDLLHPNTAGATLIKEHIEKVLKNEL